jgi:hypothetical protein
VRGSGGALVRLGRGREVGATFAARGRHTELEASIPEAEERLRGVGQRPGRGHPLEQPRGVGVPLLARVGRAEGVERGVDPREGGVGAHELLQPRDRRA